MPESRAIRYATFGLLYFAQGAIMSYFTALNALYLRTFGLSMSQIGMVGSIALIPFVLKLLFGVLSDRVNLLGLGHRKPYIILGLILQAACLALMPTVHPGQELARFALLAFLLMTGMGLYDTCTDGLALDTTPKDEEGTIQGFMVGGRALGVVLISGVIGVVVEHISWPAVFRMLAILTLIPLPLALRIREAPRPPERNFQWQAFAVFGQRHILALAALGALISVVINGANQIVNPFLRESFGISYVAAGFYTAVWGLGVVAGGLSGGRLTDRIGQRRAVQTAMLLALVAIGCLSLTFSAGAAWPLVALFGLAFGYYETVYFATSMQRTDPRVAASMFAILMAFGNIGTMVGFSLSGGLVDAIGHRGTFAVVAMLNLLALPLLPFIFQHKPIAPDAAE